MKTLVLQDIIVRVCFILGNLSSDNADTRDLLFSRHSALPTLNAVFDKYLTLERQQVINICVDNEDFVLKFILWLMVLAMICFYRQIIFIGCTNSENDLTTKISQSMSLCVVYTRELL